MKLLLLVLVAAFVPGTSLAQKAKKVNCLKDLKKAVELIDIRWSFKVFKPGAYDLQGRYKQLEPEAKQARTPAACANVLARFMSELRDGHSRLQYFPGLEYTAPKITIRSQRERLTRTFGKKPLVHAYVFARDTTDETLRAILPGSEILSVDGVSIDSMYAFMETRASGSTPQWIDYMCDRQLLLGPTETQIELTLREPGGARKTVTVRRPSFPSEKERKRESEIYLDTVRIARWKRLDDGWGYLKYTTFAFKGLETTVKAFDQALDSLMDAPGLIIDLRGNGGGYVGAMTDIAGRFVSEKSSFGFYQIRRPGQESVIEVLDWSTGSYTTKPRLMVKPRKKTYRGPVVILIDRRCFSACEGFTGGLQALGRVLVIGSDASGGGSGFVSGLRLPSGAIISFSWTVAWRPDGQQIEGHGVPPDIRVRERPRDWVAGRDRVLERAIQALKQGEAKGPETPPVEG